MFSRGGPDRTLDLTYNKLYGEFPRFLVNQGSDLSDSCLCTTNFTVSDGNQLYCPTKESLDGVNITPNLLDTFKQAGYKCLLPKQTTPVRVESRVCAGLPTALLVTQTVTYTDCLLVCSDAIHHKPSSNLQQKQCSRRGCVQHL